MVPPRLDGNADQPGRGGARHRHRADGRQVHAAILPRLHQLHQHAARAFPPQSGATREQRIGALDRLDPQHQPLLHHRALPDIDGAERPHHGDAAADVLARPVVRGGEAQQAGFGEYVLDDGLGGDDLEAVLLQHPDHRFQQPVIALQGGDADADQHAGHAGIRADRQEGWPLRPAAHHDLADAMGAELLDGMAAGADADGDMRHRAEIRRVSPALDHHGEHLPPTGPGGGDDPVGHLAATGDQPEGRGIRGRCGAHGPSPFSSSTPPSSGAAMRPGRTSWRRRPLSWMKAMISITSGSPA